MVNILTPIKGNFYERVLSYFNCRLFLCFCFGLFLFVMPLQLLAEGSKELTANGGNRAFLLSSTSGSSSFPFPTLGTMKVYAKAGEVINIGSSAQALSISGRQTAPFIPAVPVQQPGR
jgi:hypothetical protein